MSGSLEVIRSNIGIPLGALRTVANLTLTASTDPTVTQLGTSALYPIVWHYDDDSADTILLPWAVPEEFDYASQDMHLRLLLRKVDATADENTDLKFQAQITSFTPPSATAFTTLTTTAKTSALAASTTATTLPTGFAWYDIDIGKALQAESKRLRGGDQLQFEIGPNEQVGATDMTVELAALQIRYAHHLGYPTTAPSQG